MLCRKDRNTDRLCHIDKPSRFGQDGVPLIDGGQQTTLKIDDEYYGFRDFDSHDEIFLMKRYFSRSKEDPSVTLVGKTVLRNFISDRCRLLID